MKIKLYFYAWGLCALFASEAGATGRPEVLSRLAPSHMHYLKSCFALERGDEAKARDELRLARLLDEGSPYLHLEMQRRKAAPSSAQGRPRRELSSIHKDEHSRVASADPMTEQ